MAPAHIPVFLSQKPSTEDGINRSAILFLAWIAPSRYVLSTACVCSMGGKLKKQAAEQAKHAEKISSRLEEQAKHAKKIHMDTLQRHEEYIDGKFKEQADSQAVQAEKIKNIDLTINNLQRDIKTILHALEKNGS